MVLRSRKETFCLSFHRRPAHLALAAVLLAALCLAACGRKGDLSLPPGASLAEPAAAPPPVSTPGAFLTGTPPAPTAHNGFDASGNPVAPPGQRRSFFLDPLLN
jgi:predicted small lipoprotein YifL